MHFDPVGTEQTSQANIREFTEDDVLARQAREVVRDDEQRGRAEAGIRSSASDGVEDEDEEREDDELEVPPARKVREGLPARFRMRHTPHYVDELLGDAPPRTVREIPITEIESPVDDNAELDGSRAVDSPARHHRAVARVGPPRRDLSRDCRHASVARGAASGARYGAVPGARPQRVDEGRLTDLRDAAMQRLTIPPPPVEPEPVEPDAVAAPASTAAPEPTIGEAALGLEFVTALLPAMNAAGNDRLRWGVLTDLAAVELARTKSIAAAQNLLRAGSAIDRASVDHLALVSSAVSAIAVEARLRGVRVELSAPDSDRGIFLDGARCRDALTGLLQSLLALAPRGGTLLSVSAQITSIRPALIVECRLARMRIPSSVLRRCCGSSKLAGVSIRAARMARRSWPHCAQTARAHGGRVDVKLVGKGCLVTFVVPRLEG